MRRFLLFVTLIAAMLGFAAYGAGSNGAKVYFVNIYPGSVFYELEGHSAIVVDVPGQVPLAYNFGVFDFDAPNFVYRFVKGETDYRAAVAPAGVFISHYAREGRRVVAHELDFDSVQTARLIHLLRENVKPENATYRYNYVKDNCATRPLRAVELAAGDTLLLAPAAYESNSFPQPTFRNIMRHYHRNYPWYQFGIDLALGSGIDYTLNRREMAFAPAELDAMLPGALVGGKKLVKASRALVDVPADNAVKGPTPWYATPLFVCWLVFAAALCFTVRDIRRMRVNRVFDTVLYGIFGLAGLVLTFLIFISVHEATSPNVLYLWLNPLCFAVPALIWIKKAKIVLMWWQIINFAALLLLIILWCIGPQSANAAFFPLVSAGIMRSASYIYINRK